MTMDNVISDEYLQQAQSLVSELKSGNNENAAKALDQLINSREKNLFTELGKLTREFHDALMGFRLDSKFSDLAETEIPDARDRLNHVIKLTNDSADSTLTAVENSIPLCDDLAKRAEKFKEKWSRFQRKEMCAKEFRELSDELSEYFNKSVAGASSIKEDLNKVLMAQSFQDLTGQIIKQVITLVDEVESNLVNLVKLSSEYVIQDSVNQDTAQRENSSPKEDSRSGLDGPQIPGKQNDSVLKGQDDVDDLLSSLGF